MAFTGAIGEIYLISASIGTIYFAFGVVMGQLHGLVDAAGGHLGHLHIGHDAGTALPGHTHGIGAHAAPGHSIGTHSASGAGHGHAVDAGGHGHAVDGGAHGGHGHSHADAQADGPGAQAARSNLPTAPGHGPHGLEPPDAGMATGSHTLIQDHRRSMLARVLSLLNPMSLAIFLTFFGVSGLILLKLIPALGILSIIPAVAVGLIVTAQILRLFTWLLLRTGVSSEGKVEELIGNRAQISVPIKSGRMGEVTCVMGSKRYNYPAKPLTPNASFESGTNVMIADFRDSVVYVEPWTDLVFETDQGSIIEIPDRIKQSD